MCVSVDPSQRALAPTTEKDRVPDFFIMGQASTSRLPARLPTLPDPGQATFPTAPALKAQRADKAGAGMREIYGLRLTNEVPCHGGSLGRFAHPGLCNHRCLAAGNEHAHRRRRIPFLPFVKYTAATTRHIGIAQHRI